MKRFKHSGAFGDLVYSLPIVKHLGGGEFYLHLDQINWIGQHYYGSQPDPVHQGRLNQLDYESIAPLLAAQEYITSVGVMSPATEITHNLDRFRPPFVGHPGNYVDIYSAVFGITDAATQEQLRNTSWLTVPEPKTVEGRDIVINRTARWLPSHIGDRWDSWARGWEKRSVFVGLPEEYAAFCRVIGWDIPHQPTNNLLELAEYIAGAATFIGNQSVALAIAIGLGKNFWCEYRKDLPIERNECYFPKMENIQYF
jgi:hypothetical protein